VLLGLSILLLLQVLKLTWPARTGIIVEFGEAMPLFLLGVAIVAAWFLRRRLSAAMLCLAGGIALSAWGAWLDSYLGSDAPSGWILAVAGMTGAVTCGLVLQQTGNLFGMLLAGLFAYLGLQAVNSFGRFGLVAGVLLSANLGGWVGQLLKEWPAVGWRTGVSWACRLGMIAVLAGCVFGVASERYARWIGDPRHLRLRERPLTFAHEAARFAGQRGLPQRALVYDIAQSCVYVYHNAPDSKVFMDARLETPTLETFQRYTEIEKQLNKPGGRWSGLLDQLGDVVIMLSHDGNVQAETTFLSNPRWRCVYFDALATVFVRRGEAERERRFPTFDPAGRHFAAAPSQPGAAGAASEEAEAAYHVGMALGRTGVDTWEGQIPWLLLALDRAEQAVREEPESVAAWTTMGNCHWKLIPDRDRAPPGPHQDWDPTVGMAWAQSTFCFRQALEHAPDDESVLQALFRSFGARRMADAQREVGARLFATAQVTKEQAEAIRRLLDRVAPRINSPVGLGQDVSDLVMRLLQSGRPREATLLAEEAGPPDQSWGWPIADRLAGAWMHLGYPQKARVIWERATGVPTEAVRLERLASTYWAGCEFDKAAKLYQRSLAANPRRPEVDWALAWLHTQRGDAIAAHQACRRLIKQNPTNQQREEIGRLERLLVRSGDVHIKDE
jgi:tetratricopeptide (TPR) repeat protein